MTINKADIDVSEVTAPEMNIVETGNAIDFVVNNLPSTADASIEYFSDEELTVKVDEAKNVGTYFVKISFSPKDSGNYNTISETLTSKLMIRENDTGISFAGGIFDYDGTLKNIAVDTTNAKSDGDFEVSYFEDQECTTVFAGATNAGSYAVYAKVVDKNHVYSDAVLQATLKINKVSVPVPVANTGLKYNGNALVGVDENSLYDVTNGSATNAGQYTATVTLKDSSNYKWEDVSFNGEIRFDIAKADIYLSNIVVNGLGNENSTKYNGKVKEVSVDGLPTGLVSAKIKYYADSEHNTEIIGGCKKAGTYYVVVTFNQLNTTNYNQISIEPVEGELIIDRKELKVTWSGETEYFYDGKAKPEAIPTCTINADQVIGDDVVSLKVTNGGATIKFVGNYDFNLALEGESAGNYYIDPTNVSYLVSVLPPERNSLVSDWSTLKEGDYALVVNNGDNYYAMTNNLTSSSTVGVDQCFSIPSFENLEFESTYIWHISVEEGEERVFYISVGDKYLSYSGSGETKLKLVDSKGAATKWLIGSKENIGSYFYSGERALLLNKNTNSNCIGFYKTTNVGTIPYGLISLYKVVDNRSVNLSYEELDVEGCELSVVSSTERLTDLYPCVDTLSITVTVPNEKILTTLTVRDENNNILEELEVEETVVGTNTVYKYNKFPEHSGKIVATVVDKEPFTVSKEDNAAVTIDTSLPAYFYAGKKVTLKVTVSDEYKLLNVIVTGASGTYAVNHEEGTNNYSFIMPNEDVTISYEVEAKVSVMINAAENTSVSVSSEDGSVTNGSYVEKGSTLEISTIGATLGYNSSFTVTGASLNSETGKYEVTDAVTITSSAIKVTDTTKISDVISAANALDENVSSTNQVKVTGVVISSTGYSEGYKNYDKIVISDSTGEITLFRAVKGSEGIDLIVGDTVTAIGYFVEYVSDDKTITIYELSKNNNISPTIVSVDHIDCEITYSIVDSEGKESTKATLSEIPSIAKSCSKISFSATPSSGHKIVKVTINDVEIPLANGEYSFVVSNSNVVKVIVDVASGPVETKLIAESLDFTSKSVGHNSYKDTWIYGNWTVSGGANNNNQWDYAKLGGKNEYLAEYSDIYLLSKKVEYAVTKVEIAVPTGSLAKTGMTVNSWSLNVYSDKECTKLVESVSGGSITNNAETFEFTPNKGEAWASGCYYKVVFDLSNTTTNNGIVCISSVNLYAMK